MSRKEKEGSSKNKLTRKQKTTVSVNIKKRIEEIKDSATKAVVISHMGYNIIVQESRESPLLACDWRQNIGYICAGDNVLITQEKENYIIEAVLDRETVIEKQNVYRGAKPFAANIEQIIVIITHEPMFQTSLLDRYLITANKVGIDTLIFFNKTDILKDEDVKSHIAKIENTYKAIPNVAWVSGSVETGAGLDELMNHLDNRKTVITGQSGVGKSSLINKLIPNLNIQTMNISAASGLGKHSTTNSTLYHLGKNGILIDTPGVRSFDTYHLTRGEIDAGFAEISPYLGYCQFSNCSHTHESKCSILDAIKDGKISEIRYKSYLQTLSELKDD